MRIVLRNYKTNQLQEVDSDQLTDELAQQLIPQDENSQAIYTWERRARATAETAMNRALSAHFDLHGRH